MVTTRCGRLLQRLVGQPVPERASCLSSARSVVLSVLGGAVSSDPVGNVAREEAGRRVVSLKRGLRRPARSGEPSQSTADEAVLRTSSREEAVQPPPPVSRSRGPMEMALSRSRDQWRTDEATRAAGKRPSALLVLGQSEPPVNSVRPVNPIWRRSTESPTARRARSRSRSRSRTEKRSPTCGVCPTYRR